jgi:hypothetical protein
LTAGRTGVDIPVGATATEEALDTISTAVVLPMLLCGGALLPVEDAFTSVTHCESDAVGLRVFCCGCAAGTGAFASSCAAGLRVFCCGCAAGTGAVASICAAGLHLETYESPTNFVDKVCEPPQLLVPSASSPRACVLGDRRATANPLESCRGLPTLGFVGLHEDRVMPVLRPLSPLVPHLEQGSANRGRQLGSYDSTRARQRICRLIEHLGLCS